MNQEADPLGVASSTSLCLEMGHHFGPAESLSALISRFMQAHKHQHLCRFKIKENSYIFCLNFALCAILSFTGYQLKQRYHQRWGELMLGYQYICSPPLLGVHSSQTFATKECANSRREPIRRGCGKSNNYGTSKVYRT